MSRIDVSEISRKLANNIHALVGHLLPAGRQHGNTWEVGSIHGEPGKTLKVNLAGEHQGRWVDWNGQEHKGDALDLWAQSRNIALPEAIREAKRWLGIADDLPQMEQRIYSRPKDDKQVVNPQGPAMHWLVTERKLKPEIVNRYRVQGDSEKKAIIFPAYSPEGTLINRSYRTLTAEKKVWQDKDAAPCLFGWHALTSDDFASREILICEGQIDAMTWAQWGIPALSVPNGSGNKWLDYEWENLQVFKTIYLSFDNDGKTAKSLKEAVARLGKHRVRVVRFSHKDANDALKAGVTAEQAKAWLSSSEYETMPNLVHAEKFADEVAEELFPDASRPMVTIPATTHKDPRRSFEFRPGELTLWTGVSGHGKSTMLNQSIVLMAVQRKRPSLIFSFEMLPRKVIVKAIFGANMRPGNKAEARMAAKQLSQHLLFCDRNGSITEPELFEMMEYAYARYGIGDIVIDSLMRVRGLQENYPAQTEFITRLVTFTRDTGTHVHLVAHPRKQNGHAAPQAHDIAGSSHIRDNADNVLVVWRNREKEQMRERNEDGWQELPDAKLIVEKDRERGEFIEFALSYDRNTYRYSVIS